MSSAGRPPRVLVVEDDPEIAQVLLRSLRMEGYEARASYDGESALGDAREFTPDLVILDLGLPKLDGIDVARLLRKDGDVPILMLTARDAAYAALACASEGPRCGRRRLPRQAVRAPGAARAPPRPAQAPPPARQRV